MPMPPKKKDAKKSEDTGEVTPEQILASLRMKNSTLELRLREKLELMVNAQTSTKALEEENREMEHKLTKEKQANFSQSHSMGRDFEVMLDLLYKKIALLTRTESELKKELAGCESKHVGMLTEKERDLEKKEREISILKGKMGDMSDEFNAMLKTTLMKMQQRIELSSTHSFDPDRL